MVNLKPVLAYLRKSRDEENDPNVLSNHRQMILELCEREGYDPIFFEEIGSSEKIAYRTEIQKLLKEVATGRYYAVVAVDTDRLSRGDVLTNPDIVTIYGALTDSKTILHTVRDGVLNPVEDKIYLGIKTLFANMEYETIKSRLYTGKVEGAKRGKWTNGKPPFPYYYDRETKEVLIDKEKLSHYRLLIELYLELKSIKEVATELNRRGIPSPGGKRWNTTNVHRLLRDETHLGKIIFGKTEGSGHKSKNGVVINKPRNEWIIVDGEHEPVKTQEEHDKIMSILARNQRIPRRARQGFYPLSGLLFCGQCGWRMTFARREYKGKESIYARCSHVDWDTNPPTYCPQKIFTLDEEFYDLLFKTIDENYLEVSASLVERHKDDTDTKQQIARLDGEISKAEKAIERVLVLYEEGAIDKDTWLARTETRREQVKELKDRKAELEETLQHSKQLDAKELDKRMQAFKRDWYKLATPKQMNNALKKIIKKIVYDGTEEQKRLEIHFL